MENIVEKIESKGGFISTIEMNDRAEYLRVLRAVERGELCRVRHGVYAEPSAILNTMLDVEKIVPNGVVCLYNAWAFYQLSTIVPPSLCIAINAKRKVCLPNVVPVNIYYWKNENFSFGITVQSFSNYRVRMTDLERSVCDAVKYRNKVGIDVCAEVVRTYLRRKDRNMSRLAEYADKLRVKKVLDNYLDICME